MKNTLRKHKYAILLAALIWVALVESFSNRQVLGPNLSDLVIVAVMLLVFLIVFDRWLNRLVAFIALASAAAAVFSGHYVLPPSYPRYRFGWFTTARPFCYSASRPGSSCEISLSNTSSALTTCLAECAAICSLLGRGLIFL